MVPPLLAANTCVGIYLRCVALPNLSRKVCYLRTAGGLPTGSGVPRKRKRPAENEPYFLTQRVSNDTPN